VIYAVGENIRYQRVRMISSIRLLEEKFVKPVAFNLAETWKRSCKSWGAEQHSFHVKIKASAEAAKFIRDSVWKSPYRIQSVAEPEGDKVIFLLELLFENLPGARSYLLGWGNSIEVLEPEPLRFSIADFARQVLKVYE